MNIAFLINPLNSHDTSFYLRHNAEEVNISVVHSEINEHCPRSSVKPKIFLWMWKRENMLIKVLHTCNTISNVFERWEIWGLLVLDLFLKLHFTIDDGQLKKVQNVSFS